jgi:hypothetical protein
MKALLIKLSEQHYIVVDDSVIEEGDLVLNPLDEIQTYFKDYNFVESKKITHSTQPLEEDVTFVNNIPKIKLGFVKINPLSLSEVEEAIYGYNIGKLAELHTVKMLDNYKSSNKNSFIEGFKAHQELMKDKLFTVEDMKKAIQFGIDKFHYGLSHETNRKQNMINGFIQSLLPKTEWEVAFKNSKLKLV